MIWKDLAHSNTIRGALITMLGAAIAYLSGQVDERGAALLALTGIYQLIQRGYKLRQAEKGNQHETAPN